MKPVVAIFAHPDDEAFGPAGTLALLARERDVYLICVTDGSAGMNSSQKTQELSKIRRAELLASAKTLGIKQVFFLNYPDGTLANNLYHEIAEKIQKILEELQPEILITYESHGITGHLDHIAVSMITSFVFDKLPFISELWYHCFDEEQRDLFKQYYPDFFIYVPQGYKKSAITKVIAIDAVWEQKRDAMSLHESQKHDVEKMVAMLMQLPKEEYFIINKK